MTQTRGGTTLDKVTDDPPAVEGGEDGGGGGTGGRQPAAAQPRTPALPALPDAKTSTATGLEHKTVTIFGPAGVGKTTLASQWAGGGGFFFNCAGELGDLDAFQLPVTDWREAKLVAAAIKADPKKYPCSIIDTADRLGQYCAVAVRATLGITHESDAEYGKGWTLVRDEYSIFVSKLAAIPNHGVVLVTHSAEEKIKTRNAEWTKFTVRGQKGVKESILDTSDLVLFIDFSDDDEKRVIKTKPNRYYDAKERGEKPRLPAEIEWPLGVNGWNLINGLWKKGGK